MSSHDQNSPDRQDRGHLEEVGGQDHISTVSGDTTPRTHDQEPAWGSDDPHESEVVMTQTTTTSQGQGSIMTGSNRIPERFPMARQSLGQVLLNQLEHRRRAAQQTQTPSMTSHVATVVTDHG